MTIAISLTDAFDIETYDGLIAFLVAHLELDAETEAQLPTLIRLAEYRLNRMITAPERETTGSVTTTADLQYVALPVDFRQLRTAYVEGYPLAPVTLNVLHSQFTDNSGKPQVYTVADQSLYFGPVPDSAYTITLTYMARLTPLSSDNQTNWLLSGNADAYVYASLMQISAWQEDLNAAALYKAELETIIEEVNRQGNRYRNASPVRLRSPVVV